VALQNLRETLEVSIATTIFLAAGLLANAAAGFILLYAVIAGNRKVLLMPEATENSQDG